MTRQLYLSEGRRNDKVWFARKCTSRAQTEHSTKRSRNLAG